MKEESRAMCSFSTGQSDSSNNNQTPAHETCGGDEGQQNEQTGCGGGLCVVHPAGQPRSVD